MLCDSDTNSICLSVERVRRRLATSKVVLQSAQVVEKEHVVVREPLEVWRRMARIVRMLCAVCIALRSYAIEAGLLENYIVSVKTRRTHIGDEGEEDEELCFDLQDYIVPKEPKVPVALRDIMDTPPMYRTSDNIHAIGTMIRDLPSFRKYTKEMQQMMCRIVRYQKCGKRRVVLRKGHLGFSVYFIYSGSVSVVLDQDDNSVFVRPEVITLRKGACFGEIALMQNTRRNATIVCAEDSEFLVIDKEDFLENGLDRQVKEEYKYRFDFFRNWPPLASWTDDQIQELSYISRTEDFNHNKVIIKDSRTNEWLWWVVKGSCEVLRLVDLQLYPQYRRIRSLRSCTPEIYFMDSENKSQRMRAQSAPHRLNYHSQNRKLRPKTSLGLYSSIKEEESDNKANSNDNSETSSIAESSGRNTPRETGGKKLLQFKTVSKIIAGTSLNFDYNYRKGSAEDRLMKSGIYVKVDTMRDGMCFGLESLFEELTSDHLALRFSMVSKQCTLIHVPRSRFKEMADPATFKKVKDMIQTYPSDMELCERFLSKSEWDAYKHGVVEEVVFDIEANKYLRHGMRYSGKEKLTSGGDNQLNSNGPNPRPPSSRGATLWRREPDQSKHPRKFSFAKISGDASVDMPCTIDPCNNERMRAWKAMELLQSPASRGLRPAVRKQRQYYIESQRSHSPGTPRSSFFPKPTRQKKTEVAASKRNKTLVSSC